MPANPEYVEPDQTVSIITPTYGREALLPLAYHVYASQDTGGRTSTEWIVIDDSPQPSPFMESLTDSSVRYFHLPQRLTIGEKRNLAIDAAHGDIIVQFDDDEYYAPSYIKTMLCIMQSQQADFIKLSSFFIYSFVYHKFGYWNLLNKTGLHIRWGKIEDAIVLDSPPELENIHLGFGFSYVFRKQVWERNPFPAVTFNEDGLFILEALKNGYKVILANDDSGVYGVCLRLLHRYNTSGALSQYVIPEFIASKIFPGFFDMLPKYTAALQLMEQNALHTKHP